jgi:hypothetical protein
MDKKTVSFTLEKLDLRNEELLIFSDLDSQNEIIDSNSFIPDLLPPASSELCYAFHLPIFLKEEKQYRAIARKWALRKIVNSGVDSFYAIILTSDANVRDILSYDQEERLRLTVPSHPTLIKTRQPLMKPTKHTSTQNRRDSKKSGKTCPFCGGPINRMTGLTGLASGDNCRLGCEYRNITSIMCKFAFEVSEAQFSSKRFKTSRVFEKIPDRFCPDCGDDMYSYKDIESGITRIMCRKVLFNDMPQWSRDEFDTAQAKSAGLSQKRLCQEIADAKLAVPLPAIKFGLQWLNKLIEEPGIYDALVAVALDNVPQGKRFLIEETEALRARDHVKLTKVEKHYVGMLNRIAIETAFPSSPKLFMPDGNICKKILDVI